MSKWIHRRSNGTEPNFAFRIQDQKLLKETSPTRNPVIQVWTEQPEDDIDENNKLPQVKVCSECEEYDLKYLDKLDRYYCFSCGHREDPETKKKDSKQLEIPFGQRGPYASYDQDDQSVPFITSIDVNKDEYQEESNNIELLRSSEGGRIRKYKVKGLPLEAMSAVLEAEGNGR